MIAGDARMMKWFFGRGLWLLTAAIVLTEFTLAVIVVLSFGSGEPCPGT